MYHDFKANKPSLLCLWCLSLISTQVNVDQETQQLIRSLYKYLLHVFYFREKAEEAPSPIFLMGLTFKELIHGIFRLCSHKPL